MVGVDVIDVARAGARCPNRDVEVERDTKDRTQVRSTRAEQNKEVELAYTARHDHHNKRPHTRVVGGVEAVAWDSIRTLSVSLIHPRKEPCGLLLKHSPRTRAMASLRIARVIV